jgi:hypothetical protein
MKIRTGNMVALSKGALAENAVQQWFEARGHKCVNVGKEALMHDLEVSGYGRVQVKTCRKERHHRTQTPTIRMVCSLAQGNTGARYPLNAFEWLACVYWLKEGPRVWLVSEDSLRSENGVCLKDKYKIALSKAVLIWSAIDEPESLVA